MISRVRRPDGREQENRVMCVETYTFKRVEPGNESRVTRN